MTIKFHKTNEIGDIFTMYALYTVGRIYKLNKPQITV